MPPPCRSPRTRSLTAVGPGLLALLVAAPAHAYIGPGAGFALLGSGFVLITTVLLAAAALLIWPFRTALRMLRHRRRGDPWVKRLIIVGFDGQDPKLTERYLAEGLLPSYQRLKDLGCYHPLQTTYPSISPVAWSSFSTGTNPAKHNIYDFLDRDPRSYLPVLSSTHIGSVKKVLKLGKYRIPLEKPEIRLLRKSQPMWLLLGQHNVWSTVLRVPITFPPEKFYGAQLSAMCAPDLLGSQGTFLLFTTRPAEVRFKEGGLRFPLEKDGGRYRGVLRGPENTLIEGNPPLEIPLTVEPGRGGARLRVGDQRLDLRPRELSDYVTLRFSAAPGVTISGLTRFLLLELDEHVSIYATPLNIDPEKPAMPISHPDYYATYLAKRCGPYTTLGLAEDTWALNEGVIDDRTFLKQTYDIDAERERMLFASLERLRTGTLFCVFDATDRIQHMFWRYLDEGHPALRASKGEPVPDAIEAIYKHNDRLIGKVLDRLEPGDLLMVLSDHGFSSFRRGVNLNAWLLREGYLHLKPGGDPKTEWLKDVDWSKTRAFALGLTGMFLNLKGREASGIVEPGAEARALKAEIAGKLNGIVDPEKEQVAINECFDTAGIYNGPYLKNAPDLVIGYNAGYRASWDGATGVVAGPSFEDNVKAWSGDHCIDPRLVPGIFFCNRKIDRPDPALIDIAPTALKLFGVDPPGHMEGRPLFEEKDFRTPAAEVGS